MVKLNTRKIRLDAATICQLKCPACPTAAGEVGKSIGSGYLKFETFKEIVDNNPDISNIELSNWGELFLNKDLVKILEYAYKKNVRLAAANGANLNTVKDEVLEALVKYKFLRLTVSIDGATQESYEQYRKNGKLAQVLKNIERINFYKKKYRSEIPYLKWQFIAFGHNQKEINKAREMANDLNMEFAVKLSWGDLYTDDYSPVLDREQIRRDSGHNAATRDEYAQNHQTNSFTRNCCLELWHSPQINYDGKILGCPINYWGDFGKVNGSTVKEVLEGEKVSYAKEMLQGKKEPQDGIPCTTCKVFFQMKKYNAWVSQQEIELKYTKSRLYNFLENKIFGIKLTSAIAQFIYQIKRRLNIAKLILQRKGKVSHILGAFLPGVGVTGDFITSKGVNYALPVSRDPAVGWKTYSMLRGFTQLTEDFGCHVSTLDKGKIPHAPHKHKEEELLIMLQGEADLILPTEKGESEEHVVSLKEGELVYYPAGFLHTLQSTSEKPANYMMFRWYAPKKVNSSILEYQKHSYKDKFGNHFQDGFSTQFLFEGTTDSLKKLHCHVSTLAPGAGYDPHIDGYDVALVLLEGEVETLGKTYAAPSVIFYTSGEAHGIKNATNQDTKYLVFEFHN